MKSPPLSKESLLGWLLLDGFATSAMTHFLSLGHVDDGARRRRSDDGLTRLA
jgi:hypothetical protein